MENAPANVASESDSKNLPDAVQPEASGVATGQAKSDKQNTSSFLKSGSKAEAMLSNFNQLRSEEHTSELQSRPHLVCRLLLEKKKKIQYKRYNKTIKCDI